MSTKTYSEVFKTAPERINFLNQYYDVEKGVQDAAYYIVFHDNSGGYVPGPSDWHYVIALKYMEDVFEKVKSDFNGVQTDSVDLTEWQRILPKDELWQTSGPYLQSNTSILILKHRILLVKESSTRQN